MAAKEKDTKEKDKKDPAEETPEASGKRGKKVLILGIAAVLLLSLAGGGFFVFKTFLSSPVEMSAQAPIETDEEEDEPKAPQAGEKGKEKASAKEPPAKGAEQKPAASAEEEAKPADPTFGETWTVPRLDLNLGNALENRFLRLGLTLEYRGGKAQTEELTRREPQIRDIIITTVSTRTRFELLSSDGKEKLRRELLNRFNEVLERPINNVFFSEFLVE